MLSVVTRLRKKSNSKPRFQVISLRGQSRQEADCFLGPVSEWVQIEVDCYCAQLNFISFIPVTSIRGRSRPKADRFSTWGAGEYRLEAGTDKTSVRLLLVVNSLAVSARLMGSTYGPLAVSPPYRRSFCIYAMKHKNFHEQVNVLVLSHDHHDSIEISFS